jgi:hypothetical protein
MPDFFVLTSQMNFVKSGSRLPSPLFDSPVLLMIHIGCGYRLFGDADACSMFV